MAGVALATETARRADPAAARRVVPVILALLLLVVVALRFAQPIEDGDIFWHMAYGSQMIERGTLHTDHSLYSWMPASNATIYCAWVSELLFLGVWKAFGLVGIFGLRYAAVLAVVAMLAIHARRCGVLRRVETWLALLMMLLASVGATFPKPEMLSFVLWNAVLFCYFGMLLAVENCRNALPWIYAIPALMLLWANVHGGFILAAPFFVVTGVAAYMGRVKREARHVTIAWGLSALATVATPYGVRYPLELIDYALGRTSHPDTAWNNAFQPTFSAAGNFYHLPELFGWMTGGLLVAALLWQRPARRRHLWIVAALYLAYLPLSLVYVRSAFLLPAIFGYGLLTLAPQAPELPNSRWRMAAAALFVFLSGRAMYEARFRPDPNTWMGFGISYFEPVEEAEFLRQGNFGPRLYNTFNSGGYLLWSLYPRYQVMADARSFPYLSWFDELYRFTRTQDATEFQGFLDRHPADAALVDFEEDLVWRSFLKMPGWRPVFYGPSAAVFVPAGMSTAPLQTALGLTHLRNAAAGLKVFDFAVAVGDYRTAWRVLDQMEGRVSPEALEFAHRYREGHAALRASDYHRAYECFESAFRHRIISGQDNNILLLLRALQRLEDANQLDKAPKIRAALALMRAPE